jgi:hypothetical protein
MNKTVLVAQIISLENSLKNALDLNRQSIRSTDTAILHHDAGVLSGLLAQALQISTTIKDGLVEQKDAAVEKKPSHPAKTHQEEKKKDDVK